MSNLFSQSTRPVRTPDQLINQAYEEMLKKKKALEAQNQDKERPTATNLTPTQATPSAQSAQSQDSSQSSQSSQSQQSQLAGVMDYLAELNDKVNVSLLLAQEHREYRQKKQSLRQQQEAKQREAETKKARLEEARRLLAEEEANERKTRAEAKRTKEEQEMDKYQHFRNAMAGNIRLF